MRKGLLFAVVTITFLLTVASPNGYAQSQSSDVPKVEVGVHFSLIRLRDLEETSAGVGGRLVYNLTNNIGVETEFNYFPGKLNVLGDALGRGPVPGTIDNSHVTQVFFGGKYAIARSETAGIFGKVRPGFVKFGGGGIKSTNFALDFGGVLELYTKRNLGFRFDVGDTIIRFGDSSIVPLSRADTSHNLQIAAGVLFRF